MLTSPVISAVKKTFSRSQFAKRFKEESIVKGKKGKRGGKIAKCNICGVDSPYYKTNIDHIDPIVPLMIPGKIMSFFMLYERTFCNEDNLQVLCKDCHDKKSKKEMGQRVKWRRRKKFLVVRHKFGSRIKVIPIIQVKNFPIDWECLSVFKRRKDADSDAKKRRKL